MAATFDEGEKMRRWKRNLERPQAALKQIGALMVAESQKAFRQQRFGRDAWMPRSVPNVFGILADFQTGRSTPKSRRFDPRPALKDTGRLSQSIAFRLRGQKIVEVGANVGTVQAPYASVHHTGGETESVKITKTVQNSLERWLKNKGSEWRKFLGKYLNPKWRGKTDTMEVPERPLVGITKQTRKDVLEAVGVKIMEVR